MDLTFLEKIGLTQGESKVYIALLYLGSSSVGPIINRAKVSRSKVYDILDRLIQKGLVSYVYEGKTKKYDAVSPKRLHEFLEVESKELEQKKQKLEEILPTLENLSKYSDNTKAEVFHGPRGIKAFFDMSLYDNKEINYVLGYPKEASLYFHAYWRKYHKERIRRKQYGKVLYDYETWFCKNRGKRKYVEQRYLPEGIKTPAFIYIFGDTVGTIVFTKEQKLCFMIKNQIVADRYKEYFMMLWDHAVKTGK